MTRHARTLILLLLVPGFLSVAQSAKAQTLHAILVVDTKDQQIGECTIKDLADMSTQMDSLARQIGYKLHLIVRTNEQFGRAGLEQALAEVTCAPADVLLFYYSGHGFAAPAGSTDFPQLYLKDDNSLDLESLHRRLLTKHARFCLTLGDCCNNVLPVTRSLRPRPVRKGLFVADDLNILHKLFAEQQGDVLITTARRGERAAAFPTVGSFYTSAWLEAVAQAQCNNKDITWQTLLNDAEQRLQVQLQTCAPEYVHHSFWKINLVPLEPKKPDAPVVNTPKRIVSFDVLNGFLNQLVNEKRSWTERTALIGQFRNRYFAPNCRINRYLNDPENPVEYDVPIGDFLAQLAAHPERIDRVNIIERLSTLATDGRYTLLTVQEVR